MNLIDEYQSVSKEFSRLTGDLLDPLSERCCSRAVAGTPLCCWTVATNESCNVFTEMEIELLWQIPARAGQMIQFVEDGLVLQKHGRFWFSQPMRGWSREMLRSLHTGRLSQAIENTAHPTRPIVMRNGDDKWQVIDVVSVSDCIAEHSLDRLRLRRAALAEAWQGAVDLLGVKPYYRMLNPGLETL